MDITYFIWCKSFIFHKAGLNFELSNRFNLGTTSLKLLIMILSPHFYPKREVFVLQQPKNLQVALSQHDIVRFRLSWASISCLRIVRTFWYGRLHDLYWDNVFCSNIGTIEFELVLLSFSIELFFTCDSLCYRCLTLKNWFKIFFDSIKLKCLVSKL